MQNSPASAMPQLPSRRAGEMAGAYPARFAVLYGTLVLAILGIGVRIAYVQTHLSREYLADVERTSTRVESIPARAARILSSDGTVLAEDVEIHAVKAHYRWLQDPPDPQWLKQVAWARLPKPDRRNRDKVRVEIERVQNEHLALWQRLAELTGVTLPELKRDRRSVQLRVERMRELIVQRRLEEQSRVAAESLPGDIVDQHSSGTLPRNSPSKWSQSLWQRFVTTLTTSPERDSEEPIVLQEERDFHTVLAEITPEAAVEIESHPELYPGLRVELSTRRRYPRGELAAHVIGYRTPLTDEELAQRSERYPEGDPLDYHPGDRIGRAGIELAYDRRLRGLRGQRQLTINRRGEVVANAVIREPRAGQDVILALHVPLQQRAEQILDRALQAAPGLDRHGQKTAVPQGGCVVALDVRTGGVLAAASAPRFDLGKILAPDNATWDEWTSDTRKPLFHRVTEMTLPPGSVFKVVTAVALLEALPIDPEQPFFCQGYLDQPDRHRCITYRQAKVGHGELNLTDALARSCNVYFFDGARRAGPGALVTWAEKFGFGQATGVDLPGEEAGHLPAPAGHRNAQAQGKWYSGDTLGLAIGQSRLTVTPLQVARMMAAVANGGTLVRPQMVEGVGPTNLSAEAEFSGGQTPPIDGLSPRTLAWVRRGLSACVADPRGTGYKTIRLPNVAIAGKTGTAENGSTQPDHAWFAGYAPAENPRVAFVVVLEHGGSGGSAAGPVAREFVQELVHAGLIEAKPLVTRTENR